MPTLAGVFNQKQTYKPVAIKIAHNTIPRMKEENPFLPSRPCDPRRFPEKKCHKDQLHGAEFLKTNFIANTNNSMPHHRNNT
jgi:hypothetical protein